MQHDEVIWQVVNQNFCSFKIKTERQNFCKHPQSVSQLCNRQSCPLANSRYATVMEEEGRMYLWIKTIERAHSPKNLWEKVKLSRNYERAVQQIEKHLAFWPNFNVHRVKQRHVKITQYLMRMRRLRLKVRPKLVGITKKVERREKVREAKAQKAARLEDAIKNELLERLRQGVYGDLYAPQKVLDEVLDQVGTPDKESDTVDAGLEEEDEEEDEEESEDEEDVEYVEAFDKDVVGDDDLEDWEHEEEDDESSDDDDDDEEEDEESSDDDEEEEGDDDDDDDESSGEDSDDDDGERKAPGSKRKPDKKKKVQPPAARRKRRHVELEFEREEETARS